MPLAGKKVQSGLRGDGLPDALVLPAFGQEPTRMLAIVIVMAVEKLYLCCAAIAIALLAAAVTPAAVWFSSLAPASAAASAAFCNSLFSIYVCPRSTLNPRNAIKTMAINPVIIAMAPRCLLF